MTMNNLAVKLEGISKEYRYGFIGQTTLREEIQSWWARLRHREDPNSLIVDNQTAPARPGQRFLALDSVSFEVRKGESLGLIGRNGAGKSTLLKLICQVTAPNAGTIYINGRITSMLEIGTGFHPELSGRENVYLNGAILGMTRAEIDRKFDRIVEFSEVGAFIDTPVKRYSSGMKVKLAFAVASHLDSEIMIMDEVLAVGDVAFQNKCIDRMKEVAENEGRTIIYVSHNLMTIRRLCQRCVVLDKGKMVFDGPTDEAIGIYLKNQEADACTSFDLTQIERIGHPQDNRHRMTRVELPPDSCAQFEYGIPLRWKFSWISHVSTGKLKLKLLVSSADLSPVGATPPLELPFKQGDNSLNIDFDTRNLVPGRYCVEGILFEDDQAGNATVFDQCELFRFRIVSGPQFAHLRFWRRKWGSAILGNLTIDDK